MPTATKFENFHVGQKVTTHTPIQFFNGNGVIVAVGWERLRVKLDNGRQFGYNLNEVRPYEEPKVAVMTNATPDAAIGPETGKDSAEEKLYKIDALVNGYPFKYPNGIIVSKIKAIIDA